MNIDIRKAVKSNFLNSSEAEIAATIDEAIKSGEEKALPGLGVLMEELWKHAKSEEKNSITKNLSMIMKR